MGGRSRKKRFLLVPICLVSLLVTAALAGCAEIRVVDATPYAPPADLLSGPVPATGEKRDLAVVAVEFDPPLDLRRLVQERQPIMLLVAIENRGSRTEHDVTVEAQITTPHDPGLVLIRSAGTARIASGEIQVVRFPPLSDVPLFDAYRLEVSIDPLDGEVNLDDNRRAFDIQIRRQPEKP